MRSISSSAVRLFVGALLLTVILAGAAVFTIQGLINTTEANNATLQAASSARADLTELHYMDLQARTGAFLTDPEGTAAITASLVDNVSRSFGILDATEQATTLRLLDGYISSAVPETPLGVSTAQAGLAQSRYDALLQELDLIERLAQKAASDAARQTRTGTVAAAAASLFLLAALMLYVFRISRRSLTGRLATRYSERFEAIIADSPDFVFVLEDNGELSYLSPAVHRIMGTGKLDKVESLLNMLTPQHAAMVSASIIDPTLAAAPVVLPVTTPDGLVRQVELRLSDQRDNPAVGALVVSGRDVTAQKALESKLAEHANTDELTGLPNRRALNGALRDAMARSQRNETEVGFLLLDLDGFKGVNDTLGHPTGDELLKQVARRLSGTVRQGETVGRIGGDEFAVVLEGLETVEAGEVAAERLAMALRTPYEVDDQLLALGVSGGLVSSAGSLDQDELFRCADIALYEAKSRGRGRIELFETEMEQLLVSQMRLKREIEAGFERKEFTLVYQPLLTVDEQETVGFEALMRWESPALGTVPPLTFIPICERTGMIIELGRWALRAACLELAHWQSEAHNPALSMSVNVSVVQLSDADFVADLRSILTDTGIDPTTLQLEITESVIAASMDDVIQQLQLIRSLGVRIALDDFGTGYSSMGQLQMLPVDCIKIDRSFINALRGNDQRAVMVVNALVELGRALGLQVIAEGVEELDQLSALVGPQCDLAQGFLLAHPMPAHEILGFIESSKTESVG